MLYLSTRLRQIPLLSVRSGGRIGTVIEPIINPHNLHLDGFYCESVHSKTPLVLLDMHVRDISPRGIIIDDHNHLSEPDELIRLQPVLDLGFQLEGKRAVVNKRKIGKVTEYAIDTESLFIQKIYVQPRIWQSLQQNNLTFDRTSVLEVTDAAITFSGPEVRADAKASATSSFAPDYSASAAKISE